MSRLAEYIYKFKTTPKKIFMKQVYYKLKVRAVYEVYHVYDALFDTRKNYSEAKNLGVSLPFDVQEMDFSGLNKEKAEELWRMYSSHRFDLLGSGWVKNGFINNANGLDGYRYDSIELQADRAGDFLGFVMNKRSVKNSAKIWRMIDSDYEAIDWQKDYKSGYRWGADKWYRPQGNAKKPGGDIKVPWELARLQHFPRFALLAEILPEKSAEIFKEYCNQLLDFIAQNPPRMGVNYMCTMDVGIRAANIALSYSLFKQKGFSFSKDVERVLINFMFEQCNHIRKNLEWSDILTSNHYFADIAGLLYGSAVLPDCKKKEKWLQFAVEQIKQEIVKQFYEEGSNAEGSTAYHRLTGEMAVYSVALIHGLAVKGVCEDASQEVYNILYGAGKFTHDLTRPDGAFTQIGDNDSGLFFKLSFTGEMITPEKAVLKYNNLSNYKWENDKKYLDENLNDGRTFVSAVCGMTEKEEFVEEKRLYPLEYSLVRSLMNNTVIKTDLMSEKTDVNFEVEKLQYEASNSIMCATGNLTKGLERIAYPKFGIYIYKSPELYLCINATDNGQKGNAGHAHNDKLSYELFINGKCICEDAGTYVYTALPQERNKFRSTQMHNTIFVGKEQNEYINLFSMKSKTTCMCLQLEENRCTVKVEYDNVVHIRRFDVMDDRIDVTDYCNFEFESDGAVEERTRGYGKKVNIGYCD
ncbi:MAG: alginate lyase family protein [Lachnospiraceae bacterium]|nr:alginate lyase family protein [Lachnospiraceae bacterium]